jgi:hypothetical protein
MQYSIGRALERRIVQFAKAVKTNAFAAGDATGLIDSLQ